MTYLGAAGFVCTWGARYRFLFRGLAISSSLFIVGSILVILDVNAEWWLKVVILSSLYAIWVYWAPGSSSIRFATKAFRLKDDEIILGIGRLQQDRAHLMHCIAHELAHLVYLRLNAKATEIRVNELASQRLGILQSPSLQ